MSKLFIYYSMTGNGDLIADILNSKGYDIRKIYPKRNLPKNYNLSLFIGGFLGAINHKAKLKEFDKDISKYDEIVIGTPIWNGKFACPTNTLLNTLDLSNKKVSFIIYSGSGNSPMAINKAKSFSEDVIEIRNPKKNPKLKEILDRLV